MDKGQVTMDIPSTDETQPSHKQDTGGAIPPGWSLRPLREIAPLQRGFDLPTSRIHSGPHPVVYSNGVLQNHERAMVKGPGVVTGRSGTIGKVHFLEKDYWPHNTTLWVTSFLENNPQFIYYLYAHIDFARFLAGSGVPTLNRNDVHRHLALTPPFPEQCAIAEALSDMDDLLAALENLIAKKRAIKQAAMQQLLTGKTRLPGFSGKWETKPLGELTDIDPENLPANLNPDYEFNYIALEHVEAGRLLGYTVETFRTSPSRARRRLRCNDVLVATVRPNLMGHFFFNEELTNAVCSTGFAVLRYKSNLSVPGFLFAHLFGSVVNKQIERILAGSNYPAISSCDVAFIEIPCPPTVREQTAIASILSDMDAEIATLEQRRDKTRILKQGMMQQLLTGRVRLVRPGEPCP